MFTKFTTSLSFLVILLGLSSPVISFKVNITNFQQCEADPSENSDHLVTFTDVSYECNAEGFCDIVHAKYHIPTINDNDKLMNITMWRCGADSTDPCNENSEYFYEVMECERFHIDETGPWAMFSRAMVSGSKCGAEAGTFDLANAQLKNQYITDFMAHDVKFPRHRMRMVLRKVHGNTEATILRCCVYVDFTIVFDS